MISFSVIIFAEILYQIRSHSEVLSFRPSTNKFNPQSIMHNRQSSENKIMPTYSPHTHSYGHLSKVIEKDQEEAKVRKRRNFY
jgi:hypothetical protein